MYGIFGNYRGPAISVTAVILPNHRGTAVFQRLIYRVPAAYREYSRPSPKYLPIPKYLSDYTYVTSVQNTLQR